MPLPLLPQHIFINTESTQIKTKDPITIPKIIPVEDFPYELLDSLLDSSCKLLVHTEPLREYPDEQLEQTDYDVHERQPVTQTSH